MSINQFWADNCAELRENYIARGFNAKVEGKLDLAAKFFLEAMELSPPKDLEFMLSLDVFAMYREIGQYDKAKEVLSRFEKKGYLGLGTLEIEEIKASLMHLDLIQEMLLKANTPNLPYSKIPALIKISAEEKINDWKNESV